MSTELTSKDYQGMTGLMEAEEKALLDVPMAILLRKCKIAGASDKYLCVKILAETLTDNQLKSFLESKWSEADVKAAREALGQMQAPELRTKPQKQARVAKAPASKEPRDPNAPAPERIGRLSDEAVVHATAGTTSIQAGSLRAKLLDALEKAKTRTQTVAQLTAVLAQDARPVIAKLRAAGWVEIVK